MNASSNGKMRDERSCRRDDPIMLEAFGRRRL
jgi:hypothetical protein